MNRTSWQQDGEKDISYDGRQMTLHGPWPAGPIQKVVVAMLALRMEEAGLHPFHASAVRYRDRTVLFLGGESNHGKSMGQIEACRRGAFLVSTETTVIDEDGRAVLGSKHPFLKRRTEGTERADKAAPEAGVKKFFGEMPEWQIWLEPSDVDVVVVPAIDGNFDPSLAEMIPSSASSRRSIRSRTTSSSTSCSHPASRCRSSIPRPSVALGPGSSSGSPHVPTTSSAPRRRRCSWTRWIGSCSGHAALRVRTPGHAHWPPQSHLRRRKGAMATALAGGTDLIIGLRDGSVRPDVVVDLKGIEELEAGIRADGDRLVIGARAVMEDIAGDPRIRRDFIALAEAAAVVGSVQIRNRATLAGNICNASPAADTAPALLVYGARVVAVGPLGSGGSRSTTSSSGPASPRSRPASW